MPRKAEPKFPRTSYPSYHASAPYNPALWRSHEATRLLAFVAEVIARK